MVETESYFMSVVVIKRLGEPSLTSYTLLWACEVHDGWKDVPFMYTSSYFSLNQLANLPLCRDFNDFKS